MGIETFLGPSDFPIICRKGYKLCKCGDLGDLFGSFKSIFGHLIEPGFEFGDFSERYVNTLRVRHTAESWFAFVYLIALIVNFRPLRHVITLCTAFVIT